MSVSSPESGFEAEPDEPAPVVRKRLPAGERRLQILQTLALMLEQPGAASRITTAALAARLQVSEAALYRHFASKAQMFEGLIEFIEQTLFTLAQQMMAREASANPDENTLGRRQAARLMHLLLQFAEKNPGMARVMCGDALVQEDARLQQRINQLFDRLESTWRQCLRPAAQAAGSTTPTVQAQVQAAALVALAQGRLLRYARSDLRRLPGEQIEPILDLLLTY